MVTYSKNHVYLLQIICRYVEFDHLVMSLIENYSKKNNKTVEELTYRQRDRLVELKKKKNH